MRSAGCAAALRRMLGGLLLVAALASCAASGPGVAGSTMTDHFHWQPATTARPVGWLVFLPGASGLRVFQDGRHYADVATRLNARGWHVLLVDYKPAYHAAPDKPDVPTARKIAWVTEKAIEWIRTTHADAAALPGGLVGWSLGGEGVYDIVNDGDRAARLGVRAAALYYPSNQAKAALRTTVPLLILTGERDDVVKAKDVRALVEARAPGGAPVDLHVYPDGRHGFDIASLVEKRTLRILPLIGPKATLQYDPASARDAEARLAAFLDGVGGTPER